MRQCTLRSLFLILIATLVAFPTKAAPMTPEEAKRIDTISANVITRCVGRYLIDLPESFVLNSESTTDIEGVSVKVEPREKILFEQMLEARQVVLSREHMNGKPDLPRLKQTTSLPRGSSGLVFNRTQDTASLDLARTLELKAWLNGFQISMQINAIDASDPKYATDSYWKARGNETPRKLALLLAVYERVSGRKDTEIPGVPGLCIPNGFVAGASREDQETDAVYHLAGAPDVWFGISSSDEIKEDESLFQRASGVERAIRDGGSKTLRKSKRTIHGQPYEEWLVGDVPGSDQVKGSRFMLNGNETRTVPEQPFIEFKLLNGKRIPTPELSMEEKDRLGLYKALPKATLSEAEALAIWDKVSATLRPRPGAF